MYQSINLINTSKDERFLNKNNQIDTTGRINEKINKSRFHPENTLLLTNNNSLQTLGNVEIGGTLNNETFENPKTTISNDGLITSENINTKELSVGVIQANYRPNTAYMFNTFFYGITNLYTYFIDNNNNNAYYIHNKSLEMNSINLMLDTNDYILTSFMYDDNLYVIIKNTLQSTTNKILVYNTNIETHIYRNISFDDSNNYNYIYSVNMNNNSDVYLFYENKICLLLFINKIPSELITLLSTEQKLFDETIYNAHNVGEHIYILCNLLAIVGL